MWVISLRWTHVKHNRSSWHPRWIFFLLLLLHRLLSFLLLLRQFVFIFFAVFSLYLSFFPFRADWTNFPLLFLHFPDFLRPITAEALSSIKHPYGAVWCPVYINILWNIAQQYQTTWKNNYLINNNKRAVRIIIHGRMMYYFMYFVLSKKMKETDIE